MEVIVGKTAGFCYGVKRAVEGAIEEIEKVKNINCLGEIVHNKQVIKTLQDKGLNFIENIEDADSPVIIRAHGVAQSVYKYAKKNNIEIYDYTCPNVLKIHDIADNYSESGYFVLLCGNKEHPENIGTISYCQDRYLVINTVDDAMKAIEKIKNEQIEKVLLLSQTTYSLEKFETIRQLIEKKVPQTTKLEVKNTICNATKMRQDETKKISNEVDYMIIIGGKNSSNTRKLFEIAEFNCQNAICVEDVEELKTEDFGSCKSIGIMAGASTPNESIEAVEKFLKFI